MPDEIDISEVVGPYAWGIIHHAAESFPCPPCAEEGTSLMRFAHDLVNYKLGKPVKYPEDLTRWVNVAMEAADRNPNVELVPVAAVQVQEFASCDRRRRRQFERCSRNQHWAVCAARLGCMSAVTTPASSSV